MKYLLITLVISCISYNCNGQTFIGPLIGYDLSKIESPSSIFWVQDKGFSISSLVIGVKIEELITKSIFISYQLSFTHKDGIAYTSAFYPIYGFKYDYQSNNIKLKYKLNELYYIGGAYNFNLLRNLKIKHANYDFDEKSLFYEKGCQLTVGLKYHNIDLELYYYRGITSFEYNREWQYFRVKPIQSIGINLSYDIKVFDRINLFEKKGQHCPKF